MLVLIRCEETVRGCQKMVDVRECLETVDVRVYEEMVEDSWSGCGVVVWDVCFANRSGMWWRWKDPEEYCLYNGVCCRAGASIDSGLPEPGQSQGSSISPRLGRGSCSPRDGCESLTFTEYLGVRVGASSRVFRDYKSLLGVVRL